MDGCIFYAIDTLRNSLKYLSSSQFPECVEPFLSPTPPRWHVSQLLKSLVEEGRIDRYGSQLKQVLEVDATLFIVRKDWHTLHRNRTNFHMGLIFKEFDKYCIFHSRQSIILPHFLLESTGVISHTLEPEQFRSLCDLWNNEREVESFGGGIVNYSLYN